MRFRPFFMVTGMLLAFACAAGAQTAGAAGTGTAGGLSAQPRPAASSAAIPGREISMPPDQVKDSFFAYAIGILVAGLDVEMTNQDLKNVLTEFKTYVNLPFDLIESVKSTGDASTGKMDFSIDFTADVRIPIPFSFLGYHPGSILATRQIDFVEYRPSPQASAPATQMYVLRLSIGLVTVDVDDWLVFLFPRVVDDLYVELLAIFRYKDTWYGLLSGIGRKGEQLREYFDFTRNKIIFPIPKDLDQIGAAVAEGRMEGTK